MNEYLKPADILLPRENYFQWSVIACDQFTSEPGYWEKAVMLAGDSPSALKVTLPEIYLDDNAKRRIADINQTMLQYRQSGVLCEHKNSMVYVQRQTSGGIRQGIVGLIDLAQYDYSAGSHSLIRATEATVVERIPPRVRIRKDASLELPHILLLVDDPDFTVIKPLSEQCEHMQPAYDFNLMLGGGHITGYYMRDEQIDAVNAALNTLLERQGEDKMLFAVGDGNHSLATALECYRLDPTEQKRYSLVEVVNIHDSSIEFEPIYRVIFGVQPESFIKQLTDATGECCDDSAQRFEFVYGDCSRELSLRATSKLPVGTLQAFIDSWLTEHPEAHVDYIHGIESVRAICRAPKTLGILFEGMKKNELFDAVRSDGSLPRKTFSMGTARDKRYYIEARSLI